MPLIRGEQLSGSFATSGSGNFVTTASFVAFTASYYVDSSSFNTRLLSITGSNVNTGSLLLTSSFNSYTSSLGSQIGNIFSSQSNYLSTSSFLLLSSSYSIDSSSFNNRITSATGSPSYTGSLLLTSSFNSYTSSVGLQISNIYASESNYTTTSSFIPVSSSLYSLSGSYHIDSSSFNIHINNVYSSESNYTTTSSFNTLSSSYSGFSGSYNTDSSSFNSRINTIPSIGGYVQTSSFNSYSSSVGIQMSNIFSSQSNYFPTSAFNPFSSSYVTDSSSFNTRIGSITGSGGTINTGSLLLTSSFNSYTSSVGLISTNIFASQSNYTLTSSFNTLNVGFSSFSSSYINDSSSFNSRINSIPSIGGYLQTSSFNTFSSSYVTDSSSFNIRISSLSSSISTPILLFANTSVPTGNTIANASIETAFSSSYTISSNSLVVGQVLKLKAYGVYGTNLTPPNITVNFKLGGVTIATTGAITTVGSITNGGWWAEVLTTVVSTGSSGAVETQGYAEFSTAVTTGLSIDMMNVSTISVNTTGSLVLTATVLWSAANSSNTITLREFVLESLSTQASPITGGSSSGGGVISGSGVTNYLTKFSGSYALTTSSIYQSGSSILIGNTTGSNNASLQVYGSTSISGALYDKSNSSGSTGQFLAATPAGPAWTYGGMFLASGSVSSSITADIDLSNFYSNYSIIEIMFFGLIPQTTNTIVNLRVSSDGTTFDTGSGAYQWAESFANTIAQGGSVNTATSSDTKIQIADSIGNGTGQQTVGTIKLFNPGSSILYPIINHQLTVSNNGGPLAMLSGGGQRLNAQVTKAIRLLMSSGNISVSWRVYGYF